MVLLSRLPLFIPLWAQYPLQHTHPTFLPLVLCFFPSSRHITDPDWQSTCSSCHPPPIHLIYKLINMTYSSFLSTTVTWFYYCTFCAVLLSLSIANTMSTPLSAAQLLFVFAPHGGSNEQQSILSLMNQDLAAIVPITPRMLIRQTWAQQNVLRLIILFHFLYGCRSAS